MKTLRLWPLLLLLAHVHTAAAQTVWLYDQLTYGEPA